MRILLLIFALFVLGFAVETTHNIWNNNNIWIKRYSNIKNYNIIISNIVKIENKIKRAKNDKVVLEELSQRLEVQKSKLELYGSKKGFNALLYPYKVAIPDVNIYEYFTNKTRDELDYKMQKYVILKNEYYLALSMLKNDYKKNKSGNVSKKDIAYFEEFKENIDKTYLNLVDAKSELADRYTEYETQTLQKHLVTLAVIFILYFIYKITSILLRHRNRFLTMIYVMFLFSFIIVRYIDDVVYFITFLSVAAAALTLAMREVLLNLAASIYIFFSNVIRIGDRIMVQFETKHTIGDVVDISLMKMKLHEIDDYSNLKEIKSVGRTIYIPNSYIFTKVFYNYSRKKDGFINNLIEFEFMTESDFQEVEKVTSEVMNSLGIAYTITFSLNNLKTAIVGNISYETSYQTASKTRGDISIKLIQAYKEAQNIILKATKTTPKPSTQETAE